MFDKNEDAIQSLKDFSRGTETKAICYLKNTYSKNFQTEELWKEKKIEEQ